MAAPAGKACSRYSATWSAAGQATGTAQLGRVEAGAVAESIPSALGASCAVLCRASIAQRGRAGRGAVRLLPPVVCAFGALPQTCEYAERIGQGVLHGPLSDDIPQHARIDQKMRGRN